MFGKKNDEKVLILLYRIGKIKHMMIQGVYGSHVKGTREIVKLERRIIKLGGDPNQNIYLQANN